nr:MAG TPA: cysteine-rich protein [Caudoviricetes sp.]
MICPVCGKGKLLKLLPTSIVRNLPSKCKRCGQETIVNIEAPEPVSKETSA